MWTLINRQKERAGKTSLSDGEIKVQLLLTVLLLVQKAAWANLLQLHFSFGVTTSFFNECSRLLVFVWEASK